MRRRNSLRATWVLPCHLQRSYPRSMTPRFVVWNLSFSPLRIQHHKFYWFISYEFWHLWLANQMPTPPNLRVPWVSYWPIPPRKEKARLLRGQSSASLPSSSSGFLECLDFPLFTIRSHLLFLVTNLVMVSSLILLSLLLAMFLLWLSHFLWFVPSLKDQQLQPSLIPS